MCAAGGSERTLALRTAREHQPLVFCLRRGLLRSRDLPSPPWGFSPLETTPHIQQAHPSTCPKCRQRWGSRSSLNLSVSLHRLSTASDGGGRWAVGGGRWAVGGGGGGRGEVSTPAVLLAYPGARDVSSEEQIKPLPFQGFFAQRLGNLPGAGMLQQE